MNKKLIFTIIFIVFCYLIYSVFTDSNMNSSKNEVVIHRGNSGEVSTFDPQKITGSWENNVMLELFEGVVSVGPDGRTAPALASHWDISEDGLTYTFYLRKNAKWSNGDSVTSEDLVYSFRRAIDPKQACFFAYVIFPIVNAKDIYEGKIEDLTKLGVRSLDAHTFEIKLSEALPNFIDEINQSAFFAIPKKVVEKYGDDWSKPENIVTNGAYKLVEWRPHEYIKLEKDTNYWDAHNVQVEKLFFYPIEDREAALRQFRSGKLDYIDDIAVEKMGWVKENLKESVYTTPKYASYYYWFNTNIEPLNDVRVRKALSLAVDREIITEKIVPHLFEPNYSVVPPVAFDYEPQGVAYQKLNQVERDEQAKELLAEAGFNSDNPLEFDLSYNTSENHEKIAIAIVNMWKEKLGVKAHLTNTEAKVHFAKLKQKDFQVARAGFLAHYGDAFSFLDLFYSTNSFNYSKHANPSVDALLEKAKFMLNLKKRKKILEQTERIALEDHVLIPLFSYLDILLVSPRVTNFKPNPSSTNPTKYWKVDIKK